VALALVLAFWPVPAHADPNTLVVEPSAVEVAPGGTVTVALVADPPAQTLAIWAIDVEFDPGVVSTTSRDCDSLDPFPNSQTVTLCEVVSEGANGQDDTVKIVGAMIFNDSGFGLNGSASLADITFTAVGEPGRCTDLHLRVRFHADSDGEETNPLLSDGEICIEQDAPAIVTAVPRTPDQRTLEPTPTEGNGLTLPPTESETPSSGDQTPAGGPDGASTGQTASQTVVPGEGGEDSAGDGGGDGVLIWALVVVAALIVTAGLAWAAVRRRGAGSGPEGGPSAG